MSRSFLRLEITGLVSLILALVSLAMIPAIGSAEMAPPASAVSANQNQISDDAQIRQLTAQWFAAWSPGGGSMDWDSMGRLFVQEPNQLLVFDDAGDTVAVLNSWEDYRTTWEPFMGQLAEWRIEPEGEIRVMVEGDLATTVFTLTGGGVDQENNTIKFRQHGTHIWRRIEDRWAIVHEHLTTDS
ncbi:MAG: nuclear transport factor 2 family protein [Leptolyngbyaceae cyanobacterium MO_188.B28]|nr:nuclear transport factor 2 family protein [Leptolyngbyaceae cyanobacterium MO_188.B28]